jgi:hypothetical protein
MVKRQIQHPKIQCGIDALNGESWGWMNAKINDVSDGIGNSISIQSVVTRGQPYLKTTIK